MTSHPVDPAFWNGRRVFLTGHTGFKGSWLSLWLQQLGARLTGYALAPDTAPPLFDIAAVAAGMTHIVGDVNRAEPLAAALHAADPEVLIHMAAQPLVRASYRDPLGTLDTNVMGTAKLLEAARGLPSLKAIVVVTTDKCYENREWDWGYRETDALGGHDPYSASKAGTELVAIMYHRSFFKTAARPVALATARAGNVIGGGDRAEDRLVPDLIRAFEGSRPCIIRNPLARRPWQHVLDPLSGYLRLAEALWTDASHAGQGWNFGPPEASNETVGTVADRLAARWGNGARWQLETGAHPHEATLLHLDAAKARHRLHWKPRLALDDALAWTADWYKAVSAGEDANAWCRRQIAAYQAL